MTLGAGGGLIAQPMAPPRKPLETATMSLSRDMDFDHFTLAVLWQPGLCASHDVLSSPACRKVTSPQAAINRQWTLHGLWASLPKDLQTRGLKAVDWWKYGCYWYQPNHRIPSKFCDNPSLKLQKSLTAALTESMPATEICLDRHEYYKHAECFGFDQNTFFEQALELLKRLNESRFTSYIRSHRGKRISIDALKKAYQKSFGLKTADSLELRCGTNPKTRKNDILTQAWIALRKDKLTHFPEKGAFLSARSGNCAPLIWISSVHPASH